MPNHVDNRLTVEATDKKSEKQLKLFVKAHVKKHKGDVLFDLNGSVPMPKEFVGVHNGFTKIGKKKYSNWREVKRNGKTIQVGISDSTLKKWRTKYGAEVCYWCPKCRKLGADMIAYELEKPEKRENNDIYKTATDQELEQEGLIDKLKLSPRKLKILNAILELERNLTLAETY